MADEDEVVVTVVAENDEASFDEGFSGAPTEKTPPAKEEPETPPEKPAPEPKYVQVTEDQLSAFLAQSTAIDKITADSKKAIDTVNGRYGELARTVSQLQNATPAGYAVEVGDDIVKDLAEEFPELSKHTLTAFKAFAAKLKGTSPAAAAFDPNQVVPLIATAKQELSKEILALRHDDWEEVVGLPDAEGKAPETEYRKWLATQTPEYQAQIAGSWDARFLAKSIDTFKAKAATDAAAAAKAKPKPATTPSPRQARLEAAVTPRGEGGHPPGPTEDDDFNAGYKSG